MRKAYMEQILGNLDDTADNLAQLMQVTPEFIMERAPVTRVFHVDPSRDRLIGFGVEKGVLVDAAGNLLQPINRSSLDEIEAYEDRLSPAGLGRFAREGTFYIGSPETTFWAPPEPEKAHLTTGFLSGIKALKTIGNVSVEEVGREYAKAATQRVRRMARILMNVSLYYPDGIFLPPETPTQEQAEALVNLTPFLRPYIDRDVMMSDKIKQLDKHKDSLPTINKSAWQERLKRDHLRLYTAQERRDIDERIHTLLESLREQSMRELAEADPAEPSRQKPSRPLEVLTAK